MGVIHSEEGKQQEDRLELWKKITAAYTSAQQQNAVYQTNTVVRILEDERFGIPFILRIAEALRDKPNPKKERYVILPSTSQHTASQSPCP